MYGRSWSVSDASLRGQSQEAGFPNSMRTSSYPGQTSQTCGATSPGVYPNVRSNSLSEGPGTARFSSCRFVSSDAEHNFTPSSPQPSTLTGYSENRREVKMNDQGGQAYGQQPFGPPRGQRALRVNCMQGQMTPQYGDLKLHHEAINKRNYETSAMAQWERIQHLSQFQQVESIYGADFPMEIRHYFAAWIEDQPWSQIDVDNTTHEDYARSLIENLIELIKGKAAESTDFLTKVRLTQTWQQFEERLNRSPLSLVRVIKSCLEQEARLVALEESVSQGAMVNGDQPNQEINRRFESSKQEIRATEDALQKMQEKQEKFVIDYQTHSRLTSQLTAAESQNQNGTPSASFQQLKAQKERMDECLLAAAQELLTLRMDLASRHTAAVQELEELQKLVVEGELLAWKRSQQLSGNGAPMDVNSIHTLQRWCEDLAELVWKAKQQVVKVDMLRATLPIAVPSGREDLHLALNQRITRLLSTLVTSTFIVETQPPQVLKREARFTATVRLLIGGSLSIHMSQPEVKATIINEAQARALLQNSDQAMEKCCGTILNNTGRMEYHSQTGELSVTFRNMQLKKIVRSDKKGTEVHTVAEEKFCLLFQSDFNIGGNEMVFKVWTLSLPVVVTVHGNQECNAMATVLWDNQFSEPGRTPFHVPEAVKWPDLAEALSMKFKSATGRGLSQQNLDYMASKVFGNQPDYTSCVMRWYQFNKEALPGRNFPFWEWFYAVLKLTRDSLKGPWCDGRIIGFIDKTASQELLLSRPNGTFLLRFSESEIGGITIAWVMDVMDENTNPRPERAVWNLAPFTSKDFLIRPLGDRVKDLNSLVTLYPNIPKDEAFSKYYSPSPECQTNLSSDGYIRTQLINTIPQMRNAGVMNFDNPQTPQAYPSAASPASTYSSSVAQTEASAMDTMDEDLGLLTDYTAEELTLAGGLEPLDVNEFLERLQRTLP